MNAIEILKEVKRRIIADPKLWARGSINFTDDSGPCCVIGHTDRVTRERLPGDVFSPNFFVRGPIENEVRDALDAQCVPYSSVLSWNDHKARGPWDVIAMLGRAIRSLEVSS